MRKAEIPSLSRASFKTHINERGWFDHFLSCRIVRSLGICNLITQILWKTNDQTFIIRMTARLMKGSNRQLAPTTNAPALQRHHIEQSCPTNPTSHHSIKKSWFGEKVADIIQYNLSHLASLRAHSPGETPAESPRGPKHKKKLYRKTEKDALRRLRVFWARQVL